ncbi:MAG: hypothetical protein ACTHMA_00265, partial [Thermomicrobiales bacterium]
TLFASEYLAAERLEQLDYDAELRRRLHEALPERTTRERLAGTLIALALWLAPQSGPQVRRSQVASLTS